MPIYEYLCQECGHNMEALQKMSAQPLQDCPQCQQPTLVKQLSAVGFRLKGSGWYETDFKSSKQRNLSKEPVTDSNPAKKDSSSTDSGSKQDVSSSASSSSGDSSAA